jgi:BASS family bile acid:Na+ symporter
MTLSSAGTILVMPLVAPLMLPGIAADPAPLLVPMLVLVLLPLSIGVALNTRLPAIAHRVNQAVRPTATIATIVLLVSICIVHFGGFRAAVGSFAILAQFLFCIGSLLLGYLTALGLPRQRRSVLALGAGTRNLGAALVPLLVSATDQRAVVMVALAVPITMLVTRLAAEFFVRAK